MTSLAIKFEIGKATVTDIVKSVIMGICTQLMICLS